MENIQQKDDFNKPRVTNEVKNIASKDKLLEAGVYFGTNKSQWNPKMKPYILTSKKGVHIIDIHKTKKTLEFAYKMVVKYAENKANFIFVGTKKQAKATIRENALRTNSHYASERWLGGTLTNNKTIYNRVRRMVTLEKMEENNYEGYTKKEGVMFAKELAKLQKNLNGIRNMRFLPNVMIVADPIGDLIAIKEARRLGIKVIGIVDTNVDPSIVDIAIPANDDSIKSVTLIVTILADGIAKAKNGEQLFAYQDDSKIILPEELKPEWKIKKEKRQQVLEKRKSQFKTRESFKKDESKTIPQKPMEVNKHAEVNNEVTKVETKADIAEVTSENHTKTNFASLKVDELKKLIKEKNIVVEGKGLKGDLVKALEENE
ncbi:30S ribosomal protein S2 [Candidatus Mycoplasma mahonii]|uniref:30S ribosomal protein S2 n=1 Tax=Candidatus Mycoplasma mahonii TaxID=3004105 RepID=UPI003570B1D8